MIWQCFPANNSSAPRKISCSSASAGAPITGLVLPTGGSDSKWTRNKLIATAMTGSLWPRRTKEFAEGSLAFKSHSRAVLSPLPVTTQRLSELIAKNHSEIFGASASFSAPPRSDPFGGRAAIWQSAFAHQDQSPSLAASEETRAVTEVYSRRVQLSHCT
jgi:hypothetical protein